MDDTLNEIFIACTKLTAINLFILQNLGMVLYGDSLLSFATKFWHSQHWLDTNIYTNLSEVFIIGLPVKPDYLISHQVMSVPTLSTYHDVICMTFCHNIAKKLNDAVFFFRCWSSKFEQQQQDRKCWHFGETGRFTSHQHVGMQSQRDTKIVVSVKKTYGKLCLIRASKFVPC